MAEGRTRPREGGRRAAVHAGSPFGGDGESVVARAASVAASSAAFRATVEERLRALENEVADVKSRVNGLLFLAAGAVLTQVALHLLRW